jgi:hypothetical protein
MEQGNLALKLVEGTKDDRDQYINRVDVLDKVKELVMLPDDKYITSMDVAKYFEVDKNTLRQMLYRRRNEFNYDGVTTLQGKNLNEYKENLLLHGVTLKARSTLTLYTRRSVLRMGMSLENSPIAEKVRDYLLNVEESATQKQKQNALKFTGEWTKELDQYVFDKVETGIKNHHFVKSLISEIAKEIDAPEVKVHTRWYAGSKELRPLRDRLNKEIKESVAKGEHLKIVPNNNEENMTELKKMFSEQQEVMKSILTELHTTKEMNNKLYKGMGAIWRGYKELNESHNDLKNGLKTLEREISEYKTVIKETYVDKVKILEKRIENQKNKLESNKKELRKAKLFIADNIIGDKEELPEQHSFKMDRNGNLTKIN